MEIRHLEAAFGAEILGLEFSQLVYGWLMPTFAKTLYANQVLVIRGQTTTESDYLKFGALWGDPTPHALDHLRMRDYPLIMSIGNTEEKDKVEAVRNGAAHWHTDQSYEQVPASVTMLYARIAPAIGGETQFCNMVAAYRGLSDDLKAYFETLEVAHQYGKGRLRRSEYAASPIMSEDQSSMLPTVYHPLVMSHHITGEKTLYGVGQSSYGIKGMVDNDGRALLKRVKDHALQEQYIYRHKYRKGDVVLWDTFQTLHAGTPIGPATNAEDSRLLWRISVKGKPKFMRKG